MANRATSKAQSAMEYLMTYGWAILIIAVVLGALFQLGVFNAGTFAPKAPPGACQVFRPNGPTSTSFINLEGVCNGELPQYVANFADTGEINVNGFSSAMSNVPLTITGWVLPQNDPSHYSGYFGIRSTDNNFYILQLQSTNKLECRFVNSGGTTYTTEGPPVVTPGVWNFVALTYDPSTGYLTCYDDETPTTITGASGYISNSIMPFGIGWDGCCNGVNGELADIQVYNASLSANEIQALYLEGIGGVPISLQSLTGWWPLNGNANDYSGNNNNGVSGSGVTYTNQWSSGYTPP